jgi:hypothetical protein
MRCSYMSVYKIKVSIIIKTSKYIYLLNICLLFSASKQAPVLINWYADSHRKHKYNTVVVVLYCQQLSDFRVNASNCDYQTQQSCFATS